MAENSAISWTDHTFNPWIGCTKVGPGCDHCYAEAWDKRIGGAHWGAGVERRLVKDWTGPRKWDREAAKTGVRPWVFCASMADVFDNEVSLEWRGRLWQLIYATPNLNWILVTKRIGNAAKMLPAYFTTHFAHVGLVATVCNQEEADRDIPKLLATPAAWRGVSAEPLLGPIDFRWIAEPNDEADGVIDALLGCNWVDGSGRGVTFKPSRPGHEDRVMTRGVVNIRPTKLDWIIVGGESGPHARPMHPQWARDIRDHCATAGVSFFMKQLGTFSARGLRDRKGADPSEWPEDLRIQEMPHDKSKW